MNMRAPRSYTALSMLCGSALLYASNATPESATLIDIGAVLLLGGALLWNLVQLGRRLERFGGMRDLWHLVRTVGFWGIGLMSIWNHVEWPNSWQQVIAWMLIAVAVMDTFAIARKEARVVKAPEEPNP